MLTTIAFDADDTLWRNNSHFTITETTFANLLQEYSQTKDLNKQLLETEKQNLNYYGYGAKGYTLSMIETAIQVTQGRVPTTIISQLLDLGRELLRYPIELYSGVEEVLHELQGEYRIILITKGDLLDQERKISQSGLADQFETINIVSEKSKEVYQKIFEDAGVDPTNALMVGNSLRSDIIPPLEIGSYAVLIPNQDEWIYENEGQVPTPSKRFFEIKNISELPKTVKKIVESL